VRIGMGHDTSQTHKFPCRGCSEEIVLRMDLNHERLSWRVVCVENCTPILEVPDAAIVYVDANFVIPPEQQGVDRAFPRLAHMRAMREAAKRAKPSLVSAPVPPTSPSFRPYRPPDYAEEWKLLRKAWSLARHDQTELSEKQIAQASKKFYPPDHPLDDLENWVWRLATLMSNPGYAPFFDAAIDAIQPLHASALFRDFAQFYETVSEDRGQRYFDLMKDFFGAYAELSQVYLFVLYGLPIPEGQHTTSTDFGAIRMFYGNAYEQFTFLVEYLAMLNNMLADRRYDTFETLTLNGYRELDRPARFGPFKKNTAFMALCEEADNQIRNASHHGSFVFDQSEQIIRYRSGKGGTGNERTISYANYLEKCVRLFLQAMTLFRIELLVATSLGVRRPI
jgi:hypothetical protein